mgnify:CR=1 FL=1
MNKLVIFDLDGVILDSRELHYESLNVALRRAGESYVITREEHLSVYDGLNTTKKLKMLSEKKGLPAQFHNQIWEDKQKATLSIIKCLPPDLNLINIFQSLKRDNFKIAVASNSIRETVKLSLMSIGVLEYVDFYISNQDVKRTKPYPESCCSWKNSGVV